MRGAFDFHKRNESIVVLRPGMAGFSLGLGFKSKKFELNYGMTVYSKAAQSHAISLSFSLSARKKKFVM